MTKRDWAAIAAIIDKYRADRLINPLVDYFQVNYPTFDKTKFVEACMVSPPRPLRGRKGEDGRGGEP